MNSSWFAFASAHDNDDVPYRLTVLMQIAGSLVMAAGIPRAFAAGGNAVIVIGYVITPVVGVLRPRSTPESGHSPFVVRLGLRPLFRLRISGSGGRGSGGGGVPPAS